MKQLICLLAVMLVSCAGDGPRTGSTGGGDATAGPSTVPKGQADPCAGMGKGKQLNITVFLDLSDRIIKDHGYGPQWQKDTALVMHLVELFKKDAESRGTFCAKGCMRLRVEPPNAVMNSCISKTETDFSKFSQPGDRRALWSHMSESWSQCLSSAYGSAIQQGSKTEWPGSDLYGFMKDVDRYITPGYRNILVILTDGELYAENRRGEKDGNRTANLTSVQLRPYVKGNEAASIQSMKNAGLGLIDPRGAKAKLSDLEVIVLGMQPTHPNNPYIYSMLEYLWTDWFNRMGVQTDHLTLEKSSNSMDAKNALDNAIEAVR